MYQLSKRRFTAAFFFSCVFAWLLISSIMITNAAPIANFPVTVTQPDGTELHLFLSGDEHFNYMHDADGNLIKKGAGGWYVYLTLDSNGKLAYTDHAVQRYIGTGANDLSVGIKVSDIDFSLNPELISERFMMPSEYSPAVGSGVSDTEPISGNMECVVVMICFADENPVITPEHRDAVGQIYNTGYGDNGSLKGYLYAVSEGLLSVNSTLVGMDNATVLMYQDIYPRENYIPYDAENNPNGYQSFTNALEFDLISRAVAAIDGSGLLAGKNLDFNNDGAIDMIHFIASGGPSGWSELLWPHAWYPYYDGNYNPANLLSATLNGKIINAYSFQIAEMLFDDGGVSVAAHETFHTFGYPDLYRLQGNGIPVGYWDVMANNSPNPQFPNAYSRLRYTGWGSPIVEITESGIYTLHPTGSTSGTTAYSIPTDDPDVFILLEYRYNLNGSGYDTFWGSQGHDFYANGLTIARIDTNYFGNKGHEGWYGYVIADEVYYYRPNEATLNLAVGDIWHGSYSATSGRERFGKGDNTGVDVRNNINGYIYLSNGVNTGYIINAFSEVGETISFSVSVKHDPVTDIVNVPSAATAGFPLMLSGTVAPSYARFHEIEWSVVNPGTTGASINGNYLNTMAEGVATVRATIIDGVSVGVTYEKDFTITINPQKPINYLDAAGILRTRNVGEYQFYFGETILSPGWYVVDGTYIPPYRMYANGDVHFILTDNSHLNLSNGGIGVSGGNKFTVYSQSTGDNMGRLTAVATEGYFAGIGGDNLQTGGTITINGGFIYAEGNFRAAGIGGGDFSSGGTIIINGGVVTARGGSLPDGTGGGAGIGEGSNVASSASGNTITINGGNIEAIGGCNNSDAIGRGDNSAGTATTVYINGDCEYWINTGNTNPGGNPAINTFTGATTFFNGYSFVKFYLYSHPCYCNDVQSNTGWSIDGVTVVCEICKTNAMYYLVDGEPLINTWAGNDEVGIRYFGEDGKMYINNIYVMQIDDWISESDLEEVFDMLLVKFDETGAREGMFVTGEHATGLFEFNNKLVYFVGGFAYRNWVLVSAEIIAFNCVETESAAIGPQLIKNPWFGLDAGLWNGDTLERIWFFFDINGARQHYYSLATDADTLSGTWLYMGTHPSPSTGHHQPAPDPY